MLNFVVFCFANSIGPDQDPRCFPLCFYKYMLLQCNYIVESCKLD